VALAPLLVALAQASLRRALVLGFITGLVYFAGTLYWITRVMAVYGALQPFVAFLINALLVVYLALFLALFAVVMRRLVVSYGPRTLLLAPLVWVSTELGRTYLLTGFPWVLLGYSQVSVLPVAQTASLVGVYGLSALVAAVSAAVAYALGPALSPALGPAKAGHYVGSALGPATAGHYVGSVESGVSRTLSRTIPLAVVLILIIVLAAWGSLRVARGELTQGTPARVALVQGNVAQDQKWDPRRAPGIFETYLRMTRQAIAAGADLVIWPESATPFTFEMDHEAADSIRSLARESRVPILFGSDQIERGTPTKYYNSAYLLRADGSTGGVYRKMHLVPFGEYVPLKRLLFFAAPLVEAVSDFSAGDAAVLMDVDGHPVSTAICYEIVYPDLVRRFVAGGSELLTTITNDAWFGDTSAPHQHFAQASMRAIENGRYLVRAANTGISGVVDPYGRVVVQSPLFEPAVVTGTVTYRTEKTLYTRIGDLFAYLAVLTTIAMLIARFQISELRFRIGKRSVGRRQSKS
jgi:apolipoprotein N-acyltransferase